MKIFLVASEANVGKTGTRTGATGNLDAVGQSTWVEGRSVGGGCGDCNVGFDDGDDTADLLETVVEVVASCTSGC